MSLRNAGIGVSEFRLNCEKFAEKSSASWAGKIDSIARGKERGEGNARHLGTGIETGKKISD